MRADAPLGQPRAPTRAEAGLRTVRAVFLRVIAVAGFAATAGTWAHVLGLSALPAAPFLALPFDAQAVLAVLAALLPVASLGVWFGHSWGAVLWLLAVAVQVWSVALGSWPVEGTAFVLGFHATTVALFAALQIACFAAERRASR